MSVRGWFITGTDTGVGKTLVTTGLLHAARGLGRRAVGLKPLAAGCERIDGEWMNDDARQLRAASAVPLAYAEVNPVALIPAMAPHIAAAQAGIELAAADLAAAVRAVVGQSGARGFDSVFVEGAGGWLVPLNDTETLADLAVMLGYPVILVVAMRLGCLNHALLTAAAIEAAGLPLAGWVANATADSMVADATANGMVANATANDMVALEENLATLEHRLPAPRLGTLPWLGTAPSAEEVGALLDGGRLFGPGPRA